MRTRTRYVASLFGAALLGAAVLPALDGVPASSAPPRADAVHPAVAAGVARSLGISVDQARRELAAQDAAHRVAASLPGSLRSELSGTWFDGARLVVAVTSRSAAAQASAAGASPRLVTRGPAELGRLLAGVKSVVGTGVPGVYGWGIDVQANDVVVNVNSARQGAATEAAVARLARLGSGVRIVRTASQQRQQAGDVRPGSPWWPGSESNCSIGFPATDANGGKHFLTAGHCTNDANQAAYGQQGQANRIGTSNVGGSRSVNAREGDMGVVAVTEAGWNLSASVNTWGEAAVTVTGSAEALVGDRVCHSGNTSHWQCGVVKYTHKSVDYGGGLIIEDLTWSTACSLGGDSGGAWLLGDKAVGLHDGGPSQCVSNPSDGDLSIFQPVNEALAKWNLTLVTGSGSDTSPPTAPASLRSTGTTAASVSLAWNASTDNVGVTAYDVYQGSALATTVTGPSATVAGLSADTAYTFTVKARDAAGNTSPASNAVSARTHPGGGGDTQPPTVPGNLRSTAKTSTSVSLAWNASTDDVGVAAYDVFRGTTLAATVSTTSATVTGLSADTSYSFTVQARDAAGNRSAASAALTVRTDPGGGGRTFTSGTDYAITDYGQFFSPVQSTATGQATATVTVVVTIAHSCAEDIGISLYTPTGYAYPVKYSGSGQYNCTAWNGSRTFTVPNVLSGAAGTWKLRVTDYGPGDTGVLDAWSITL
ncbi:hypothetical protein Cme02nite_04530 [Catellatospora methionotrophica]|uniref:Streptogrisin C n=1 Tax=Catellatospora methionotrophica TaxID=121620 RepID=A0A8J3PC68_9ACTN|nr:fibronectin type III domain-containing protein [Catellatospora methionotrophica]GIG12121.1 hypothetical protein Cme02nite_04530 [Catellatospora methionotrophica]